MPVLNPAAHIAALRAARNLIEDEHEQYICLALIDVVDLYGHLYDATCTLRDYVGNRCSWDPIEAPDLRWWLFYKQGLPILPQATMQLARLAWLDRMIYQLEQTGELP